MASELQLGPRADSTQSTLSVISLNRTTEKEGIVVDEGFCDVEDPSFGDAADRQVPTCPAVERQLASRGTTGTDHKSWL